jgi:hypothetical protein
MDTEDKFSRRLVARLDENLDVMPQHILARLEQSRELALNLASTKQASYVGGGALALHWNFGRNKIAALAMGVLLLLAAAAQYRAIQTTADEAADIDETILSDQAPVQSYLDAGFVAVLRSGMALKTSPQEH